MPMAVPAPLPHLLALVVAGLCLPAPLAAREALQALSPAWTDEFALRGVERPVPTPDRPGPFGDSPMVASSADRQLIPGHPGRATLVRVSGLPPAVPMGIDAGGALRITLGLSRPRPQGPAPLLGTTIGASLENSAKLRAAMADEAAARARVWRAWAGYLPTASATLWAGRDPYAAPDLHDPGKTATLSVSMPVFDGGQTYHNARSARSNARAAAFEVQGTREQVALETVNAAIELEFSNGQARILEETAGSLAALLAVVRSRVQAGLASQADLAEADAALVEANRELLAARTNAAKARIALEGLMGRPAPARHLLPDLDRVAGFGRETLLDMASQNNAGVQASWHRAQAADSTSRATMGRYLPRLDVKADYKLVRNYRTSNATEGWTVGLALRVPLVELGTVAEIAESRESANAAMYRAQDKRREVNTQLALDWQDHLAAGSKAALAQRKAKALKVALVSRQEQYRIGLIAIDEVLSLTRRHAAARIEMVEAGNARYAALVRLAAGAGMLGSLVGPAGTI